MWTQMSDEQAEHQILKILEDQLVCDIYKACLQEELPSLRRNAGVYNSLWELILNYHILFCCDNTNLYVDNIRMVRIKMKRRPRIRIKRRL